MELVGRFAAGDQWTDACALVCYRASEELRSKLFSAEYNILDELHQRTAHTSNIIEGHYERRQDEQLHDVMSFWGRLNDYRERNCSSPEGEIIENFKYHELWYDLTWRQQQSKQWRSTRNAILHKRSGWANAAKAIMEYGLPKLEQRAEPDDATEHANAIGQFARGMAKWLINFASRQHAYYQTEEYQKNYQTSIETMHRRHKRASESASSEAWI